VIQRPVQRVLDHTLFDLERELRVGRFATNISLACEARSGPIRFEEPHQRELHFGNLRDSLASIPLLAARLWQRILYGQ
jgi:hypothetical protein